MDKIPIDTAVEVKEIYSSNYKPGATATATKEIKNGYPVWTVSLDNEQIGTTTGGGLINSMQGGSGEKDGDSYKYNYQLKNQTGDLPD